MKTSPSVKYYLSRFNDSAKYIKQTPDSCEIVQLKDGSKIAQKFSAPYPNASGEEELFEVPAHEYYNYRKGAVEL